MSRIVADAFLGPQPPGTALKYLDGDARNARADNLRYARIGEKQAHENRRAAERRLQRKERKAEALCLLAAGELNQREIAERLGLSESAVSRFKKGER